MSNEKYTVEVFERDEKFPESIRVRCITMFKCFYHHYHYLQTLADVEMARFLIRDSLGDVIGFATIRQRGAFAILSNLLVVLSHQGKGLGVLLETARMSYANRNGLTSYSSCVTVGVKSQALKLRFGLAAINYKLGYRRDVFTSDDVSSAVTFCGALSGVPFVSKNCFIVNRELGRRRVICATQAGVERAVTILKGNKNDYVDLLLTPGLQPPEGFVFQGADLDLKTMCLGELWQLDNNVRLLGLRGALDLSVPKELIEQSMFDLQDCEGKSA